MSPESKRDPKELSQSLRVEGANKPSAGKPLRLLLVEDSDEDAMLVLRELKRSGYQPDCVRVDTQEGFKNALKERDWDVVIADHSLPKYAGLTALADLRATGRDIPFILISGTIGETVAVTAMKAGAQDYVLKGDLTRLPAAVQREVGETVLRAEQARVRERLVIAERMASAGTLAAGVAHEINNPLAIAVANLEMTAGALARLLERADELKKQGSGAAATLGRELADLTEPLGDAREALLRVRDIVRDVKLFSRPDGDELGTVDIRRVADSSSRMAHNEIRHRARLIKQYGEVPTVHANESRLGQVLLNLLMNAAQAIPEGHADRNEIRVTTRTSATGEAVVEVSDTGSGIPSENLGRIFDPFFTTKPFGVGTGLGLAICHGIVVDLGGRMEVESEVGKGTLFRLTLPAARESHKVVKAASARPTGFAARVLVVDDEAALGRALGRILSPHHEVTILTTGTEALAQIASGKRFDAILLDVMMPEMSGMELYEELQRVAPDQAERAIFLTGGAFSASARAFLDRIPNPRLDKPVESSNLLAVIEGVARR